MFPFWTNLPLHETLLSRSCRAFRRVSRKLESLIVNSLNFFFPSTRNFSSMLLSRLTQFGRTLSKDLTYLCCAMLCSVLFISIQSRWIITISFDSQRSRQAGGKHREKIMPKYKCFSHKFSLRHSFSEKRKMGWKVGLNGIELRPSIRKYGWHLQFTFERGAQGMSRPVLRRQFTHLLILGRRFNWLSNYARLNGIEDVEYLCVCTVDARDKPSFGSNSNLCWGARTHDLFNIQHWHFISPLDANRNGVRIQMGL